VVRVVVAEDHPLFADALTAALLAEGCEVVGVAARGDQVLDLVATTRPDAVLLDLTMPGMDGYTCLQQLRAQHADIPVLVVSGADAPVAATKVLELGAAGFIGKAVPAADLAHALRIMLRGQPVYYALPKDAAEPVPPPEPAANAAPPATRFTRRELEILQLVAEGMSNKAIAQKLWVTEQTAKFHISNILQKLKATNRTEAARRAHELGLIDEREEQSPA